jgi:hypothetical protein
MFDPHEHVLALESDASVAEHRAWQKSRLEQHLESVANAEHGTTSLGKGSYFAHDRGKPRDRTRPKVVTVREAAGKDDGVGVGEACVPVPNELGILAQHVLDGVIGIVVAIGSGKHNDGEFHGYLKPQHRC